MVADARLGVKITSNIAYRRADTWVRPYGWAREHPPHPIPHPRRAGEGGNGCPPATSPTDGRTRGSAPTVGPASIPLIPSLSRAAPGRAGFKPAPTGAALRGVGPH